MNDNTDFLGHANLNPYDPPELDTDNTTSLQPDSRSGTVMLPVFLYTFAVLTKLGLVAAIVLLYWIGGKIALWAVFVAVPVALMSTVGLIFAYVRSREPIWKEQRHAYLRQKRRLEKGQ